MLYWLKLKFQRNLHFNVLFMKLYFVIQQRKTFNKGKKDKRSYGLNVSRQFWGSGWGSPHLDFNLESFTLKIAVELFEGTTVLSDLWWVVHLDPDVWQALRRKSQDTSKTSWGRRVTSNLLTNLFCLKNWQLEASLKCKTSFLGSLSSAKCFVKLIFEFDFEYWFCIIQPNWTY